MRDSSSIDRGQLIEMNSYDTNEESDIVVPSPFASASLAEATRGGHFLSSSPLRCCSSSCKSECTILHKAHPSSPSCCTDSLDFLCMAENTCSSGGRYFWCSCFCFCFFACLSLPPAALPASPLAPTPTPLCWSIITPDQGSNSHMTSDA